MGMQDQLNFGQLFHKIFDAMIVTVLPAVVGLFVLSRDHPVYFGESYLDAGDAASNFKRCIDHKSVLDGFTIPVFLSVEAGK